MNYFKCLYIGAFLLISVSNFASGECIDAFRSQKPVRVFEVADRARELGRSSRLALYSKLLMDSWEVQDGIAKHLQLSDQQWPRNGVVALAATKTARLVIGDHVQEAALISRMSLVIGIFSELIDANETVVPLYDSAGLPIGTWEKISRRYSEPAKSPREIFEAFCNDLARFIETGDKSSVDEIVKTLTN